MDTNTHSNKIHADKFCIAATISLPIGISLLALCFVLDNFVQPHFRSLEDICVLGIWTSIVIICFVVPLLGIIAIKDVISNWRLITNPDNGLQSESLICKTARRFFMTSLLFATVSLLSVIFRNYILPIGNTNFTDLQSIWLIIMAIQALVMGFISYRLFTKTSLQIPLRAGALFSTFVGLIAVVAVFSSTSFGHYLIQRLEHSKITETFIGDSNSLKQTAIIPTLDSPCPKNKNVIWCSSFQLAWNQMKDDVIGEPIQVVSAKELAARLNSAEQSTSDLEPNSLYVAAGRVKDGIIGKIHREMAAKFPSKSVPNFSDIAFYPEGILAYSYLIANVPFEYPYRQVKKGLFFTDSGGNKTNIGAFGVWGLLQRYDNMREQVEILYYHEDYNNPDRNLQMKEFAIDLCKHSRPYQVIAAVVEPKDSLAQTLDYIDNQITDFKKNPNYRNMTQLEDMDVLMVPEMFWEIDHRFKELLGKTVTNANPPMPIIEAKQTIKFKLDRCGAILESEATIMVGAIPRYFIFNRPFLIIMKKRGNEQPFFVMWVDNAELLNKK